MSLVKRMHWLVLGLIAAAAVVAFVSFDVRSLVESLLGWIDAHPQSAVSVFIGAYIVATVAAIPASILTVAAGFLFGLGQGTLMVSVASVAGATAAFLIGRSLARPWVERRMAGNARLLALDRAVARRGGWVVLLTRLSPVFPFNLLNYAYGVTGVGTASYVLASWIGMLPGTVLYVYLGTAAGSLTEALTGAGTTGTGGRALLIVGLAATVAVTVLVTRLATRELSRELG